MVERRGPTFSTPREIKPPTESPPCGTRVADSSESHQQDQSCISDTQAAEEQAQPTTKASPKNGRKDDKQRSQSASVAPPAPGPKSRPGTRCRATTATRGR
ncbi:uncharacterized protein BKA78DRAFT_310424 [Phyllosticta capitalensis]|uniref:uncharacterized protein n=1 Tax=Phyllosticta capitalensis TaxID=121624 RepID=UPI00312E5A80